MIIRRRGQQLLAIMQPDHARLAGVFAEVWQDPAGSSLAAAAHHHDDGWIAWEKSPTVDAGGRPHDFLTIPMPERVAVYRQGIELLAASDHLAGLLTSLHFGRLLAGGLGLLDDNARHIAESFLAEQQAWRAEARRAMHGPDPKALEADYQVLRTVDYLSLLLCMRPLDELDGTSVASMTVRVNDTTVSLEPYPFRTGDLLGSVPARILPATSFESDDEYRSALEAAPVEELPFTLSRPRR